MLEKGYVYRGLKPVNWCFDCGSALAEAEVEYEDKQRPGDRRRLSRSPSREKLAHGLRPRRSCRQARLRRDLDHHAVDDPGQPGAERASRARLRAGATPSAALLDPGRRRWSTPACSATASKAQMRRHRQGRSWRLRVQASASDAIRSTTALSPVYLGDYVTLETGTGIVHSSPAYGVDDFDSCRRYGMTDDDILNPVHGRRPLRRVAAALRRA